MLLNKSKATASPCIALDLYVPLLSKHQASWEIEEADVVQETQRRGVRVPGNASYASSTLDTDNRCSWMFGM